jgi:hypothetical protein
MRGLAVTAKTMRVAKRIVPVFTKYQSHNRFDCFPPGRTGFLKSASRRIRISSDRLELRLKPWTAYAAIPRLSRYSSGQNEPSETLIRFALYQRM